MRRSIVAILASVSLVILCACAFVGCSSDSSSSGVAATVGDDEIAEGTITNDIQRFRESQDLMDDDVWAEYLHTYSSDPEKIREDYIDAHIADLLVSQECERRGITVSSDEIDSYVDNMREYYNCTSDEQWQDYLAQQGMTIDEYRDNAENTFLSSRLKTALADEVTYNDDDLIGYVPYYMQEYGGGIARRSSWILFDVGDEALAQEVLDEINAGEIDFADAAEQYSTDAQSALQGGNRGWDILSPESITEDYYNALYALSVGQVSDVVTCNGQPCIIVCTEEFIAPEELTSLDQLPEDFADGMRDILESDIKATAYDDWKANAEEVTEIEIMPMPEGLPYDVDMSSYETDETESN